MRTPDGLQNVVVHAMGRVRARDHFYAYERIACFGETVPGGLVAARVDLVAPEERTRDRFASARAELTIDERRCVRAQATAPTVAAAIDALEARLRAELEPERAPSTRRRRA